MKQSNKERSRKILLGEYSERGEYHRKLDPSWSYYPYYVAKMNFIRKAIARLAKPSSKILDVGCGEGVLVEELRKNGHDAHGIDLNYESEFVQRGDITKMRFKEKSFDVVLCLDILEHLNFEDQKKAIKEISRVLKPNGMAIFSIPNLAHFLSRMTFLLKGKLWRTSKIEKHTGDRPISEYLELLHLSGFQILERKGISFQVHAPIIAPIVSLFPGLCFLNFLICKK